MKEPGILSFESSHHQDCVHTHHLSVSSREPLSQLRQGQPWEREKEGDGGTCTTYVEANDRFCDFDEAVFTSFTYIIGEY